MSTILVEKNVSATMRDGTLLRADIYRPAEPGRYPVLVQRTPYNKELLALTALTLDPLRAAAAGYVLVIQDVRARWASDGDVFYFYRDEFDDGHDTIAWAAAQDWSNGEVGIYGLSYMGGTSWQAAATAPPALRALSPTTAPCDFWRDHLWRGGALHWGLFVTWALQAIGPAALLRGKRGQPDLWPAFLQLVEDSDDYEARVRHLPLNTFPPAQPGDGKFLPFFFDTLQHPTPDAWTESFLPANRHADVQVPALIIAGWHDLLLAADLEHFTRMKSGAGSELARAATRIVIGPWAHAMFQSTVGDLDFGLRASGQLLDLREDLTGLQLRWFDRWLQQKPNGIDAEAPVRIFVQGLNRWRDEQEWPLARTRYTPLYLRAGGHLSFAMPAAAETPDAYVYDPHDPCPTCGGPLLMPATYRRGPVDQAPILSRSDVLSYTSEPLTEDMELTGPVSLVLYAASSAPDTDWVIKLCDVHPDGRSYNVCDGVLRARYRESLTTPRLVEPGAVLRYDITLAATSLLLHAGHRLQVLVTSSDFPRYDRNPNTGELGVSATVLKPASQQIFHDAEHASHLILPLIPTSSPKP